MAAVWHLYRMCMASVPHLYGICRYDMSTCQLWLTHTPGRAVAQRPAHGHENLSSIFHAFVIESVLGATEFGNALSRGRALGTSQADVERPDDALAENKG